MGVPTAAAYYLKHYGDTVRVWIAGDETIITCRPDYAYHVLKSNNYRQRFGCETGLQHLGMYHSGIIWNNDVQKWKHLRSFFQKALNANGLDRAIESAACAARKQLHQIPQLQNARPDGLLDGLNFLRGITLDITADLMLRVHIANGPQVVEEIVQYFKAWEYFLIKPAWLYHFQPQFQKHKKAVVALNRSVHEIVETRRATEWKTADDFLANLLKSEENGEVSSVDLEQCVLEMFLAGTDTSSVTMYYTLVALSDNPGIEEKVLEEITRVVGLEIPNKRNLAELTYMEKVLKESLRAKPVGPVILRRAISDDVMDNHSIPEGTNIILHLAQMHRDPRNFTSPNGFNPEHFNKDMQFQYVPFGTGPKGCVGQYLAMLEMKVVLSIVLPRYKFRTLSRDGTLEDLETHWDIANQPTNECLVTCEER
ncbi:aromatase-like isoform X2 [Corticium candelabrum]|nr:aromatase-like isoform X2 [Corticium candelabrum]